MGRRTAGGRWSRPGAYVGSPWGFHGFLQASPGGHGGREEPCSALKATAVTCGEKVAWVSVAGASSACAVGMRHRLDGKPRALGPRGSAAWRGIARQGDITALGDVLHEDRRMRCFRVR